MSAVCFLPLSLLAGVENVSAVEVEPAVPAWLHEVLVWRAGTDRLVPSK